MAYHGLGDYGQAMALLRHNVAFLQGERLHESFGMGGILSVASRSVLVRCLTELGLFAEAIALGEEAVRIAEAVNHPDMLANACRSAPVPSLRQVVRSTHPLDSRDIAPASGWRTISY
jgi:hypothetical protein